jgi:dTMP kinase
MFIVFEGTDGSGKATQAKMLAEKLKAHGKDVEYIEFPRYGQKSAVLVEEYLNGKFGTAEEVGPYRASIFYAIDRYAASFEIKKWLKERKIVIANRYVSSNMGHQAGKIRGRQECDRFLEWLENLEFNIFGIPRPDKILLLYVPPQIGQQLVEKKGHRDYVGGVCKDIHEADLDHLKNASEAYLYVARKYNWIVIDCTRENRLMTVEEIHELVRKSLEKIIQFRKE